MIKIKIISFIGYSGSGKTYFIENAIKLLREKLDLNVAVIKNIHAHKIDEEGKDTHRFSEAGAKFAITRNIHHETTIFLKEQLPLTSLLEWIQDGPYKIDIIFLEGFRDLDYPVVLCLNDLDDFKAQYTEKVKTISGLVIKKSTGLNAMEGVPIIDIEKDFERFLTIFGITSN